MDGVKTCPRCSISIHSKAIFCSSCGSLTVATAPTPLPDANEKDRQVKSGRYFEIWIFGIGAAALLLQILLMIDYLILR
jgi:hypothetical protein